MPCSAEASIFYIYICVCVHIYVYIYLFAVVQFLKAKKLGINVSSDNDKV